MVQLSFMQVLKFYFVLNFDVPMIVKYHVNRLTDKPFRMVTRKIRIVHFHPVYCPWKQVMGYTCPLVLPQSWDDFLFQPRFFRLGSGFWPYPPHTRTTTPLPEKSWFQ